MGSESCTDQVENRQAMPTKPPETNPVEDQPKPLGPITPDSDRENSVEVDYDSPRSSAKKTPSPREAEEVVEEEDEEEKEKGASATTTTTVIPSPHTPKEGVFDPFAPGPEAKALAPQCRKYASKARNVVARRLSFDLSSSLEEKKEEIVSMSVVSDEEIVEAVYESLLETIVAKQTEIALILAGASSSSSECFTPPSLMARLHGLAETCPGAPVRPGAKSRKIDPALCRRLQFSP